MKRARSLFSLRERIGAAALAALAAALAALAAAPAAASPERLGGAAPVDVSLGRILAALIICLIIAGLAVLLIRRCGGSLALPALFTRPDRRGRALRVVETRRLSQHADICVVEHDGCEYLLLLMAGNARLLNEQRVEPAPSGADS